MSANITVDNKTTHYNLNNSHEIDELIRYLVSLKDNNIPADIKPIYDICVYIISNSTIYPKGITTHKDLYNRVSTIYNNNKNVIHVRKLSEIMDLVIKNSPYTITKGYRETGLVYKGFIMNNNIIDELKNEVNIVESKPIINESIISPENKIILKPKKSKYVKKPKKKAHDIISCNKCNKSWDKSDADLHFYKTVAPTGKIYYRKQCKSCK